MITKSATSTSFLFGQNDCVRSAQLGPAVNFVDASLERFVIPFASNDPLLNNAVGNLILVTGIQDSTNNNTQISKI